MEEKYQGALSCIDPLHTFLVNDVYRQILGIDKTNLTFDIYALDPKAPIKRYFERQTGVSVVCKFYAHKLPTEIDQPDAEYFSKQLRREYDNLIRAMEIGLDRAPYRVVRPLAINEALDYVLVEEYVPGPKLDSYFEMALLEGKPDPLYDRLVDLAGLLARLHTRSITGNRVNLQEATEYLEKLIDQLLNKKVVTPAEYDRLLSASKRWAQAGVLDSAREVLVHGDATPINFVFRSEGEVIAIDLERMWPGDAMRDIGCVIAEVRHAFYRTTHDLQGAAPFIRHFQHAYEKHGGLDGESPDSVVDRNRFWTGVMTLRMCRNEWLEVEYRRRLYTLAEQDLML